MPGPAHRWLRGLDPPIYLVGLVPILVGAAATLASPAPLPPSSWLLLVLAFLSIHLAVNLYNDAFDASTPSDRFKTHSLARMIPVPTLLVVATVALGFGCAIGITLWFRVGGWTVFVLSAIGVGLVFSYHAPPFRLSHLGLGEPISLLGFGVIPVWTTASLADGTLPARALFPGILVGLAAAIVLYYHNLVSLATDQAGGKRTLALRMGFRAAAFVGLLLLLATVAATVLWSQDPWRRAAFAAGLLPLALAAHWSTVRGGRSRALVLGLYAALGLCVLLELVLA